MNNSYQNIHANVSRILSNVPQGVIVEAAVKNRTYPEAAAAVSAGIQIIGHNYVKEADEMFSFGDIDAAKHFIGYLQKNKIKKAVQIFDMIETVDSFELAVEIDRRAGAAGKVMPVLLEINSAGENSKSGFSYDDAKSIAVRFARLENVRLEGFMTMGAFDGFPESSREYFRNTKRLFDEIASSCIEKVEMKYLSMGMSDTYEVAIQEGANIVRIGTDIFGPRT